MESGAAGNVGAIIVEIVQPGALLDDLLIAWTAARQPQPVGCTRRSFEEGSLVRSIILALGLVGASLAGCTASDEAAPVSERKVTFLCDRGQSMDVRFRDGAAILDLDGAAIPLTQQPAGSGILYEGGGHQLRGKGPEMIWTDATGVRHDCRDQEWAMKQPQISEPGNPLVGTAWRLVHFESSDSAVGTVVPPNVESYQLEFLEDGSLAMQLDCNRLHARWQAQPTSETSGSLKIMPGAMTQAMCLPGAIDSSLAADTARMRTYTLANSRLNLALEDGGVYVWEPVEDGL